jgi:glycosyltransferase involved in cell wall biosynthesis
MPTVELFTMAYNEEWMLPKMVEFYRSRVPDIVINVYDNGSTDRTVEVAKDLGCLVHYWDTNGEIRDDKLVEFKNTVWKGSNAKFVVVCDVDEWVEIKDWYLSGGWIQSEGYDMIDDQNGVRNPLYDKICVFSPEIQDINYTLGAHGAQPGGHNPNRGSVVLRHMKYSMPVDMLVARYKHFATRLSDWNKFTGAGFHYAFDEETIRRQYAEVTLQAKPID